MPNESGSYHFKKPATPRREPGFYWVCLDHEHWAVAEYTPQGLWWVAGPVEKVTGEYIDSDFTSIDEKRLTHEV